MSVLLERPTGTRRRDSGSGWRPALRIARRELLRAPARTLVVLLMVLLPVTGVVALDTLLRTAEISPAESLPAELGSAEARVELLLDGAPVRQSPDARLVEHAATGTAVLDEAALRATLPADSRLLLVHDGPEQAFRAPDDRVVRAELVGVDLRDERLRGPFTVLTGRAPATRDEVAVSPGLAELGLGPGTTLTLPDGRPGRVTGTVAVPPSSSSGREVVGLPDALGLQDAPVRFAFVTGAEVRWSEVLELNASGAVVLSRTVLRDPPPDDLVPDLPSYDEAQATTAALIGLIVVMAVLEVVLLAGPAFAVGARRSRRALALLAATGGEPRHVRRVVLAQGLLVGGSAAVLGVVLGIALAAAARAPVSRFTDARWGPFEVSVRDVVLLALLGAATAVLAALLPAWLAAREPVVAALRGRRPTSAPTALPATVGLVLLGVGVLMCLASLRTSSPSVLLIAFSALPTVVGAVLLAPVLLHVLGRAAARLPLPLRYAVRDADRQRARTAPAVAAVAATVAAAFALGTVTSSDARQMRETWSPSGPPGRAVVTAWSGGPSTDWHAVEAAARRALPGEDVRRVRGLAFVPPSDDGTYEEVQVCGADAPRAVVCDPATTSYGGGLGSSLLVGEAALEALAPLLEPGSLPVARRALADGAVVAFAVPVDTVDLRRQRVSAPREGGTPTTELVTEVTARVVAVRTRYAMPPALAVLGEGLAAQLGGATPVSVVVGDALTREQEEALRDEVALVDSGVSTVVERGPSSSSDRLALLLLVLGAGTLVLAGTFAATSLALVEAQHDFAVLGQVGARPRARRAVAGAYAAVLALAGGVLGVLAGSVPGVTAALAATSTSYDVSALPGEQLPSDWAYVQVPWLLLAALLVALPTLAGLLAALTVRSTPAAAARRRQA